MSLKILFEISWEVCNKVGGIHTVLASKAYLAKKNFENYFLLGPYFENSKKEFIEEKIPDFMQEKFKELSSMGIKLHYGTWLVNGCPKVILIEYLSYSSEINFIKGKLWENFKIDSLNSNWYDFDEAILWSWVCGLVIDKLSSVFFEGNKIPKKSIFVHSHEWMAGGAIFYLKSLNDIYYRERFFTVFTTHATMLGRAYNGSFGNLYENLENINPDELAYKLGVQTKFQCEKALANFSDKFSTVSEITDSEAIKFFGKRADKLLYNGFTRSESDEEFNKIKEKSYSEIKEFLQSYFYNYHDIDFSNSKFIFTSGRNEFKNKGVDILIESLSDLNKKLIDENKDVNIYTFLIIPIGDFEKNKDYINSRNKFYSKEESENLSSKGTLPPLSTNNVPKDNEIIKKLNDCNLLNQENSKVKVILIPEYIEAGNEIFNMNYYDLICGMDLGIFPSKYEPWGYTPLECMVYGVPFITSDLAGFGKYILSKKINFAEDCVLKRKDNILESNELSEKIYSFVLKNEKDLNNEKNMMLKISKDFTWDVFYNNYLDIYKK